MIRLFPFRESGALPAISAASATAWSSTSSRGTASLHEADLLGALAVTLRPMKNSSRVRAGPTVSRNFWMPVWL